MKKHLSIFLLPLTLSACVHPLNHNQPEMPTMDMKTVEQYHKQVMSGNTMTTSNHDISLNASDHKPKTVPAAAPVSVHNPTIWQNLPQYKRPIYEQGTTQRNTTSHKTTEVLKDTPTEKQTRTVEKSETKWNSKGFSFGL
ncbi:hypothetical protein ACUHGC_05720 [Testudinibacter sp. P27/CKL/0425]